MDKNLELKLCDAVITIGKRGTYTNIFTKKHKEFKFLYMRRRLGEGPTTTQTVSIYLIKPWRVDRLIHDYLNGTERGPWDEALALTIKEVISLSNSQLDSEALKEKKRLAKEDARINKYFKNKRK